MAIVWTDSSYTHVHLTTVDVKWWSLAGPQSAPTSSPVQSLIISAAVIGKVKRLCISQQRKHPHNSIGELCGECKDGRGVSVLLNRCTTCHNAFGILILLLSEI